MFENVNHPIKDGIIADNSTLSSRKIKEMVENATELPTPAAGDAGKALTVGEDLKYGLSAIPVELPTPAAGDNGKVLTVNSDLEYDLEAVPDELPAVTSSDNTKILTVSGGKWAKGAKIPVASAAGKMLQSKANGDWELIDNAMPMNWEEVTYQSVQANASGRIVTTAAAISRIIQRLTYGQRTTIYSTINGAYVIWRVCAFSNDNITVQRMYVTNNGEHYSEMGVILGTTNPTTIRQIR